MHARAVKFVLGPDREWEANRMADVTKMYLSGVDGFRGITFLADYHNGEYLWISFWDSRESAEASFQIAHAKFLELIGDSFQWPPGVQLFEVYEPAERWQEDA
jgi:hypothetical protein